MITGVAMVYPVAAPFEFWWVQPTVVGVGIIVAYGAIHWNRKIARLKATLDLIEGSESKEFYQIRYRAFRRFRREGYFRINVLQPQIEADRIARQNCLDFLNHYELVAVACKKGIIDENFYHLWMGSTLVRDWNLGRSLVISARMPDGPGDKGDPTVFCEFEALAYKWGARWISSYSLEKARGEPTAI
jgi:hypothetical protein